MSNGTEYTCERYFNVLYLCVTLYLCICMEGVALSFSLLLGHIKKEKARLGLRDLLERHFIALCGQTEPDL